MKDIDAEARALFERSVRVLGEGDAKRLRLARRSLLAAAPAPTPRWQAWSAGAATALVLGLGLAWWWPQASPAPAAPVPVASAPAAVDGEEPVLAEADEDADLYAWLAEAPVAAEAPEHRL